MGIYKRKQESKKTRKYAFDQESDQEKKRWEFIKENKRVRKHALNQESDQEKKKKERKHALDQESDQEKAITAKKERKHGLDQESDKEKKKKTFFLFFLLSCFLL